MALFHRATITPTKAEFIASWAPTRPWDTPADVPMDVIGSYRFDDPDGRVGMEAHLVTLTEGTEVFPLFRHPGTELIFMLEGEMVYGHGEATYTLGPGDALQLDGEGVHGPQELLRLPIRFLSVVAYGTPRAEPM